MSSEIRWTMFSDRDDMPITIGMVFRFPADYPFESCVDFMLTGGLGIVSSSPARQVPRPVTDTEVFQAKHSTLATMRVPPVGFTVTGKSRFMKAANPTRLSYASITRFQACRRCMIEHVQRTTKIMQYEGLTEKARKAVSQVVNNGLDAVEIIKAGLSAVFYHDTQFAGDTLLRALSVVQGDDRISLLRMTQTFMQMHKTAYLYPDFLRELE